MACLLTGMPWHKVHYICTSGAAVASHLLLDAIQVVGSNLESCSLYGVSDMLVSISVYATLMAEITKVVFLSYLMCTLQNKIISVEEPGCPTSTLSELIFIDL